MNWQTYIAKWKIKNRRRLTTVGLCSYMYFWSKDKDKKITPSYFGWGFLVAEARLERTTSRLWAWRATNCSTPRCYYLGKWGLILNCGCKGTDFFWNYQENLSFFYKTMGDYSFFIPKVWDIFGFYAEISYLCTWKYECAIYVNK